MTFKAGKLITGSILTLALLSGCAQSGDQQASGGDGAGDASKPVTIKYYNWDNETTEGVTKKFIEQFQAKYPNIKVESIPLVPGNSEETMKKLDVLLSSGEQVDVMLFPNTRHLFARAEQGVLAPLDELYAKEKIKPEDEYYVNPRYKDKYYGIQNNTTLNFVLLNKDALDEAGLPVPTLGWTYDDYREYAKKLNKGDGPSKRYGTYFHNWSLYANPTAQVHMQHPFLYEDGKTNFSDPTYKRFFDLRRAMEKEDKSAKPYADVIGAKLNYRSEFFNEKAAMIIAGNWMISEVGDTSKFPHKFKTAFAPVPLPSKDAKPDLYMGGQFLSIGKDSKNKDAAYQFIRFVSTNMTDARTELPGWKKGDMKPLVDRLIGTNKELYDVESLMNTLFDKRVQALPPSKNAVSYEKDLDKLLTDGFSKFILENKSSDEVQAWMVEEANKIIKQNTK
ncbi:extracellular solute-binding protein [Paenibacillus sp. GD4]|uniref:ABC transporter substrate-binding protein n=1 Tax=Paenibacillus sp. GD4 TaxID=3068890 RepID=UPI002796C125|nr:extracellular solute-binding protein [Paenibacillus sp. GD4]MDQ1911739.1 extracellular solute-binding protein [Paenibacillus sp. GD4]